MKRPDLRQGMAHATRSSMFYLVVLQIVAFLCDWLALVRRTDQQKDLEILMLCQQLRIMQRHQPKAPQLAHWEKLGLAALVARFISFGRGSKTKLNQTLLLFNPDTVLKWHRELVRRKWTFGQPPANGRPALDQELQKLVLQLAKENTTWGYGKIHGELLKLGYKLSETAVRNILQLQSIPRAPERAKQGGSWSTLLQHYGGQVLTCDFLTVETAWLKTLYAFFFIEIGTRHVHFAGCTAHPTAEWVTQQARQLIWTLPDEQKQVKFLIRDRDAKFTASFDYVFKAEGIRILRTPYRTPVANSFAERWIRSAREECLDRLLIVNQAHLWRVRMEYTAYFNNARPHQGLEQRCPITITTPVKTGPVKCRNVLGGVIHDYHRAAA